MRAVTLFTLLTVLSLTGGVAFAQDAAPPPPPAEAAPPPAEAAPPPPAAEAAPPPPPPVDLAPIRQVQIQVWMTETNENGLRELGANLQYTRVVRGIEQNGTVQQISTNTFNPLNSQFGATMPAPDPSYFTSLRPDQNPSAVGIQTQAGGGLVMNIINPGYGQIDGVFRGIEQTTDLDLISKPEVLVVDGGLAEIHAGGQVPYQGIQYTTAGAPQLKVTWQDIGVNLKLQPTILSENSVKIAITDLGVSDIVRFDTIRGLDLPVFATRSQTGEVVVPHGQTLVIGGLSSRVIQKSERRVPIVGTIPLVGMAFRGRTSRANNSHLLIFVSPTIVDLRKLTPEAERALTFWQERRWENSERIGKEVEIMQQEP